MIRPHIHVPYDRIKEYRHFIHQHKLNLEIYFSGQSLDTLDMASLGSLKSALAYAPALSFHAPFMDLSPGAVDAKVRAVTMERFNRVLDIAEVLAPRCIVFHSGYEKWKYAFNVELWLQKSIETWEPLNERAKELGVKIAIENIFEDEPSNLRMLMERMDSENFGICFDAGHCNLFSPLPLTAWLKELKPYIVELHLHDNDKSADQHLPIGDGMIDFITLFSELKDRECVYTIEAHTPDRVLKSIGRLNEFLQKLG